MAYKSLQVRKIFNEGEANGMKGKEESIVIEFLSTLGVFGMPFLFGFILLALGGGM